MKYTEKAIVLECDEIGTRIFSLRLRTEHIAAAALPGQFVSVYANDSARLLPRPISICEADPKSGVLRLVFRIAGQGTKEFSQLKPGESVKITGPLGNGFPVDAARGKRVFAIGGGIGIPPMLELSKRLTEDGQDVTAVLGFRDELILLEDFPCRTVIATEDGSRGTKGNVLDAIREIDLDADVIYACGPIPMLRALKEYASARETECWLSMEEKMACGIGACLSCVCSSTKIDEHSRVRNKRVCTEGPVFLSTEIIL